MLYVLTLIMLLPSIAISAVFNVSSASALITAIDSAQPGDTINIVGSTTYTNFGAITIPQSSDGTAAQRITLTTPASNGAIFSGQGALNLSVRAAYWTISNLTFQNQTNFGDFEASAGTDGGSLIELDGAQNCIITGNRFLNLSGPGVVFPIRQKNGGRPTTGNSWIGNEFIGYTVGAQ